MSERTIEVDYLARVEGEGSLRLVVEDGAVREARLSIFEAPRFFEALLRGRAPDEATDITARICGICPVAYQTSAANAIENAAGVDVGEPIRELRRLLYCGEWLGSHALHVFFLHAPDFLGHEDAVSLAREAPEIVERGLRLRRVGNAIMRCVGGREVHPVNPRIGGFHSAPSRADVEALRPDIEWALGAALETVSWAAALPIPEHERDVLLVALHDAERYPIIDGRIHTSEGFDMPPAMFPEHFVERHVGHSTALHGRTRDGRLYLTGPLARYALNGARLHPLAREAADNAGLGTVCRNPFRSILVRAVEMVHACEEALRILDGYEPPRPAYVPVDATGMVGHGVSEAPRGLLYHRYRIGADGLIAEATIVPPTSQNQPAIEADIRGVAEASLHLDDGALQWRLEQAIRNYDPCISCAAHFLRLDIERR